MFTGCGTALVTPFRQDSSLDEVAMRRLVRRQVEAGINFLVPCGTSGESPTLSREEKLRIVEITVNEAQGRIPVMAGAGGNNTAEIIELAGELESLGVDGLLSVTPYYNRPSQEGLYQHYKAIAAAVSLPIFVYSVQKRTGVNVEPATLKRLAEIGNLAGVKEASGDVAQVATILAHLPADFTVLSGDDAIALPLVALGGRGVISVVANEIPAEMTRLMQLCLADDCIRRVISAGISLATTEIPAEMTRLMQLCLADDFEAARRMQRKYLPLMEVNFVETNPVPVKAAMAAMGLLEPVWRLPLVPPRRESMEKIRRVVESLGLGGSRAAQAN